MPHDNGLIGDSAKATQPLFEQVFIGAAAGLRGQAFERKLYVIRKRLEHAADRLEIGALSRRLFYIVSLSANTLIYKGMLTARQLEPMFPDLRIPTSSRLWRSCTSGSARTPFHPGRSRIHTATSRTTARSTRCAATSTGCARVRVCCRATCSASDLAKLLPVIREGGSDTATFDNVLEFLVMSGRSLPHAILMMIPEPWAGHESMDRDRKAFYQYHSSLMEPWDGPASIAFTDGTVIGAVLDRNGLRPSRYYVTKNDLVIMASEVGVLDIPPEDVVVKERLHPGRIFLVDTSKGRIVDDEEIKRELAAEHPYGEWLTRQSHRHRRPAPRARRAAGARIGAAAAAGVRLHAGGSPRS